MFDDTRTTSLPPTVIHTADGPTRKLCVVRVELPVLAQGPFAGLTIVVYSPSSFAYWAVDTTQTVDLLSIKTLWFDLADTEELTLYTSCYPAESLCTYRISASLVDLP